MIQTAKLLILLTAVVAMGCGRPTPETTALPAAAPEKDKSVVPDAVRLKLTCRQSDGPEDPWQIEVGAAYRARFVAALRQIDWSQKGVSLAVAADMRAADVELWLIDAAGGSHGYAFFGRGDSFLDLDGGRVLKADLTLLRDRGRRQGEADQNVTRSLGEGCSGREVCWCCLTRNGIFGQGNGARNGGSWLRLEVPATVVIVEKC